MADARIQIILSDGKKAGETLKELGKDANRLNKELKDLKPGTEQFVAKSKDLQQVNARMKEVKEQITGTTNASNGLKAAFDQFVPFSGTFANLGRQMGVAKGGVGGLTSSFGILKGAIAATGIGLLVVVLGSLYAWFTKTEEGADKLKSVLYPLQVLFQKLTGVAAELGGKIFKQLGEAMDNPRQAIIDLGNAIKDNLIARLQSFAVFSSAIGKILDGDFKGGLKELGNATIQLTTGVKNGIDKLQSAGEQVSTIWKEAYADGQKLLDQENAIEDAEAALEVTRARLNVQMSKAMEIARDVTKTDEERLAAAREVSDIQDKLSAAEENFLRLKFRRLKLEQDIDGILTDDERLERAKMEAELIQLQADNIDKKKRAAAIAHTLELEQSKEREKVLNNLEALRVEAMQEGFKKELEQIFLQTEQKIEALTGSEEEIREQEKLLLQIRNNEIQQLRDKFTAEEAAKDKKAKEEQAKMDQEATDKKIEEEKRYHEFKSQIEKEGFDAAASIQESFVELLSEDEKSRKDHAKTIKALQIGSVTTSLAAEIQAIWEHANKNPANAFFPGAATLIAVVKTVAATVRAGLAVGKIQSAKFSTGGLLRGPKHSEGGIPGVIRSNGQPIEMEGDEFIFSGAATRAIGPLNLSRINDMLTRKMAIGGPVNPFQGKRSTASISGVLSQSSTGSLDRIDALENAFRIYAEKVDTWTRTLKVANVVTETEDALRIVNQIREDADV